MALGVVGRSLLLFGLCASGCYRSAKVDTEGLVELETTTPGRLRATYDDGLAREYVDVNSLELETKSGETKELKPPVLARARGGELELEGWRRRERVSSNDIESIELYGFAPERVGLAIVSGVAGGVLGGLLGAAVVGGCNQEPMGDDFDDSCLEKAFLIEGSIVAGAAIGAVVTIPLTADLHVASTRQP